MAGVGIPVLVAVVVSDSVVLLVWSVVDEVVDEVVDSVDEAVDSVDEEVDADDEVALDVTADEDAEVG